MRILNARVRQNAPGVWCKYELYIEPEGWGSYGYEFEERKQLVYTTVAEEYEGRISICYFAESDGYVSFFADNGRGDGYCGAIFNILVKNSEGKLVPTKVKGPWSSAASSMARLGFPLAVTTSFPGSTTGHITLERAKQVLKDFNLPYEYRPHQDWNGKVHDSLTYVLYPK